MIAKRSKSYNKNESIICDKKEQKANSGDAYSPASKLLKTNGYIEQNLTKSLRSYRIKGSSRLANYKSMVLERGQSSIEKPNHSNSHLKNEAFEDLRNDEINLTKSLRSYRIKVSSKLANYKSKVSERCQSSIKRNHSNSQLRHLNFEEESKKASGERCSRELLAKHVEAKENDAIGITTSLRSYRIKDCNRLTNNSRLLSKHLMTLQNRCHSKLMRSRNSVNDSCKKAAEKCDRSSNRGRNNRSDKCNDDKTYKDLLRSIRIDDSKRLENYKRMSQNQMVLEVEQPVKSLKNTSSKRKTAVRHHDGSSCRECSCKCVNSIIERDSVNQNNCCNHFISELNIHVCNLEFISPNSDEERSSTLELTSQTDEKGCLPCNSGKTIRRRYEICKIIGQGAFGRVIKSYDNKMKQAVALKIVKKEELIDDNSFTEKDILLQIQKADPEGTFLCVRMLNYFDFHNHTCIAFEMLGPSVFDFLKSNNYHPFSIEEIRHIGYQLCFSVNFLHSLNFIHTDLKPENMAFVSSQYITVFDTESNEEYRKMLSTGVKLIDFGCAKHAYDLHDRIIQTRHYRAPEVILELGWSYPCDIWSIGCILFELYTGQPLFMPRGNTEHLLMMHYTLGRIPQRFARRTDMKLFIDGRFNFNRSSSLAQSVKEECKPVTEYMESSARPHRHLFDLIGRMLIYDPAERVKLKDVLDDPFFHFRP